MKKWKANPIMEKYNEELKKVQDARRAAAVGRPFLGVQMENATGAVRILRSIPGTAGRRAGIRGGDQVTHVNGTAVTTFRQMAAALGEQKPGDQVTLKILRMAGTPFEQKITRTVTLGERPKDR